MSEKEDLLNTENKLLDVETNSSRELQLSKEELTKLQDDLPAFDHRKAVDMFYDGLFNWFRPF